MTNKRSKGNHFVKNQFYPGGEETSIYVWPIRGCAAVQGMVFVLSVLKRAFNFVWISPIINTFKYTK